MEKTFLVPIDFTEVSVKVLGIANDWALRTEGKIYVLHASPNSFFVESQVQPEDRLKVMQEFIDQLQIKANYELLAPVGKAYTATVEQAKKINPDLILMAAHDHTMIGRMMLGSNTDYIVHHSNCPLYIYKHARKPLANKILLPIDMTEVNKAVVEMADEWAQVIDADLVFAHVGTSNEFVHLNAEFVFDWDDLEDEKVKKIQQEKFEDFIADLEVKSRFEKILRFGRTGPELQAIQEQTKANLIMMAAHNHTMLERLTTGSTTDYLLHNVHCPFYVYKK